MCLSRTAEVEALVDTGATMLVLPADVVARLGVPVPGTRRFRYASGEVAERAWVGNIEIEILVDPKSRELRVNPASPDLPLLDVLAAA